MKKKSIKLILLTAKLCVAAVLLAWVLNMAHWNDYVRTAPEFGGKSFSLVSKPQPGQTELAVTEGMLWWKKSTTVQVSQIQPIDETGQLVRRGFKESLRQIDIPLFIGAVILVPISMLIVAWRWWLLLRVQDIRIGLWEITRLTFLGLFFNYVVPGTVGGDLVKAYYVGKHTPKKGVVLLSVFVDRMLGMVELVIMAGVMLLIILASGLETVDKMQKAIIPVVIASGVLVAGFVFLFSSRLRRMFHLQKIYQKLSIAHHIESAGDATLVYRRHYGVLIQAVLVTLVSHICLIGAIAMLGEALQLDTPVYAYFVYIPLIFIIGAIPISPGGVGLVEDLYVAFFRTATICASPILVLALLARFIPVFWSLPGLVVALTGAKLPKADEMQAELEMDSEPDSQGLA